MTKNNENTNAFLIHISSFVGYLFPLGSIITPLILWQTQKDKSPFLDNHGKEAINFNISCTLYLFILSVSVFSFLFKNIFNIINGIDLNLHSDNIYNSLFNLIGIVSFSGIIALIKIALIIIASTKASNGETYEYPITIKFLK